MGMRTVVMLSNDRTDEWSKDPELGRKIRHGSSDANSRSPESRDRADLRYGQVVECAHGDTVTLAVLDGYSDFRPLSHTSARGVLGNEHILALLKQAADDLGYRLVKKTVK